MPKGYEVGPLLVFPDERVLSSSGVRVPLGERAFDLLVCLIVRRHRFATKDELLDAVWPGRVVGENNLTIQMSALRRLLGGGAIVTASGAGYRLVLPVDEIDLEPAAHRSVGHGDGRPRADRPSLAVLAFTPVGAEPEGDYFADGVVTDIANALSRVRAFLVVASTSSLRYRDRAFDPRSIGRELGVRYLLQGTLRRNGARLRIDCALVSAESGRQLWTDRFEGRTDEVFEFQDLIAQRVAAAIEPTVKLAELDRIRSIPTRHLGAYDLCLKALSLLYHPASRAHNDEAIALLGRAYRLDPEYAYAKALAAGAYKVRKAQAIASASDIAEGVRLAAEALDAHRDDPDTLAEASQSIAFLGFEYDRALRGADRALAINPNSTYALDASGWIRLYVGDATVAIEQFLRARRLNPLDPMLGALDSGLAIAYLMLGEFEESLRWAQRSVLEWPSWVTGHLFHATSLVRLGRIGEARGVGRRIREIAPDYRLSTRRALLPYRDAAFNDALVGDLRAAGVPH